MRLTIFAANSYRLLIGNKEYLKQRPFCDLVANKTSAMNRFLLSFTLLVGWCFSGYESCLAAVQTATVRTDSRITYQKITGFGGFVNSPQFAYNYMSSTEIKKLWGNSSTAGYNIMRLYFLSGKRLAPSP